MRLEALQTEPGMFGSSYAREAAFTDNQWMERVMNPNAACLGLYCDNELIGITGILIDKEQPDLAHLVQSYIRKEYRGQGLSHILYETRLKWARERNIKRIEVGHRAGNLSATATSMRYGFKYIRSEACNWPDGTSGDILYYELRV